MSMNLCVFSGNIGKDAEVKKVGSSTVANFSVAVNGFKKEDPPMWVNCAIWGKRAEGGLIPYLSKGQTVVVSGEMSVRQYEKNDGGHGVSVDLNVKDLELIGSKDTSGAAPDEAEVDAADGL